jgi:heat shock protein HslJ
MPEPACSTRVEQTAGLVDQVLGAPVTFQVGPTSLVLRRDGVGTLTFTKSAAGLQNPELLLASQWQVQSITFGSGPYRDGAPSDDPATLSFSGDRYTVAHTCYLVSGDAFRLAGTVRFSGGTVDQHSCPAPPPGSARDEAAHAIDAIISAGVRWTMNGSTLKLETNDGTLVLERSGGNVADLTGSTWQLTGTEHDAAASSAIGDTTLRFPDESTLSITRCYTSQASVDVVTDSMTVSGLHVTKALPCPSGPAGTQEQNNFIDSVLNGDVSWSIDGDQLTITNGTNGLTFTRRR